jgi:NAD(P)-dependent dehydrogenase (short-subunit alcohol dehydrogenase family)
MSPKATTSAAVMPRAAHHAAIAADVSDRAEYEAVVDQTYDVHGSWDVLVNNAAVAITKPFEEGPWNLELGDSRSPAGN